MITIMRTELSPLFASARAARFAPGAPLFATDGPIGEMFMVQLGAVQLVRHTSTGTRLILQTAGPGDILAEASAYSERYHCDAVAVETAEVAALPRARFLSALDETPALAAAWATRLAHGMQAARLRAEIRTLPRLADRLTAWLDAGNALPARGRWQDVAAELGVTREALYRELARRRANQAGG